MFYYLNYFLPYIFSHRFVNHVRKWPTQNTSFSEISKMIAGALLLLLTITGYSSSVEICKTDKKITGESISRRCDPWNNCEDVKEDIYSFKDITCENVQTSITLHFDEHALNSTTNTIHFIHCFLRKIPAGWLDPLSNSETIYLNNSHVETIEPGSLNTLTKLRQLFLQNNFLTYVHRGTFNSLIPLEELNLANNQIKFIDEYAFSGLSKLQKLDLFNNKLHYIVIGAFNDCTNLRKLDLSYNGLAALGNTAFRNQTKLEQLNLSNNKFERFPSDIFSNMTHLTDIILSNNLINTINLESLRGNVYLHHNQLTSLSKFGPNLKTLDLGYNKIKRIPLNVFENSKDLNKLHLHHNQINNIPVEAFKNLKSLNTLNLMENNIAKVEIGTFKDLINLHFLNISSNQITELEYGTFTSLSALQSLDLSNNNILYLEITTFYPLQELRSLNISENLITTFDENKMVDHLLALSELNFDGNRWNCKWLTNTIRLLKKHGITVVHSRSHMDTNVHGIACYVNHKEELQLSSISPVNIGEKKQMESILSNNITTIDPITDKTQASITATDSVNSTDVLFEFYTEPEEVTEQAESVNPNKKVLTFIAVIVSLLVVIQIVNLCQFRKFKKAFIASQKSATKEVSSKDTNTEEQELKLLDRKNDEENV